MRCPTCDLRARARALADCEWGPRCKIGGVGILGHGAEGVLAQPLHARANI